MRATPGVTIVLTTVLMAAQGSSVGRALATDGPVATPPVPTTPADNGLNCAKRDADRTANDAGKSADDAVVDRQAQNAARDAKSATDATTAGVRPATAPGVAPDADEIRRAVAGAVAIAVGPDHMDRLTQRLDRSDRDRLRGQTSYAQNYGPALDEAVRSFGSAWRAKYGHPFNADGATAALTDAFAAVRQDPVGGLNREATAEVSIGASHGMAAVKLPLAREVPDGWKLVLPDVVDLGRLRDNLTAELAAAVRDRWPADERDAYRAVAHRVALALSNQPLPPAD